VNVPLFKGQLVIEGATAEELDTSLELDTALELDTVGNVTSAVQEPLVPSFAAVIV